MEWAAASIGLHANADKIEYMCFNQRSDISTLNFSFLKLEKKIIYVEVSGSSTETDVNTRLVKTWAANDRISVILKSHLTCKITRSLFQVDTATWTLGVSN